MNYKINLISFEGLHLSANIESPHYLTEYVEYPLRFSYSANENLPGESYIVVKRYSDFDNLKKTINQTNFPARLPPKKIFGKFDMEIINERRTMLENFIQSILKTSIINKSVPLVNFFQKDELNIADYSKISHQQVSLDFRCLTNWKIGKLYPEMGCRIKKSYMAMTNISDQKKYHLSWTEFGPEYSPLNFKSCHSLLKSLPSIQHDFIYPIVYVVDNENAVSVIRMLSELGSLHDYLQKVKPLNPIEIKYGYQTSRLTLVNEISLFGRQILIALKFLHDKGWPYGHLHIRNVLMITDQKCGLTDIENTIIGLVPQDRHLFVGILKKLTFEEIDIYCFGRLIFHMAFGFSPESTFMENDDKLRWPNPSIREVLFSILTENVLKNGFPTIESLLESSLFKCNDHIRIEKGPFKLSDSSKEFLQSTHQYSLKLLIADQKLVRLQKRNKEAAEFEMKRKQRRKETLRRLKNHPPIGDCDKELINANYVQKKDSPKIIFSKSSSIESKISIKRNSINSQIVTPPPTPSSTSSSVSSNNQTGELGRNQLLSLISGFQKSNLRKTKTNDRSNPRV